MDFKYFVGLIVAVSVLGVCNGAGTWRVTPSEGQYESGNEVILECALDGLISAFLPSWSVKKIGEAAAATISDGETIAEDFQGVVDLVIDEAAGQYNLKINAITYDEEGEYTCYVITSSPQESYSANVGVWTPVEALSLTGGDETTSIEVPKPEETFSYTRTCSASNVKPAPTITWTYSITADDGLSLVGELPEDFTSGPLPDDDLTDDGTNIIDVKTTSVDNGDGTFNVESVLTVNYTSAQGDDGTASPNLKIVATCKSSQDALVGDGRNVESSALTVDVTPREITTQQPEPTGLPKKTTAPITKGEEPQKTTEKTETKLPTKAPETTKEVSKGPLPKPTPKDAEKDTSGASKGGCTSGCVAGIVIALLIIAVGVTVLVIFYMRKKKGPKKLDNADKSSKNKKDPPPVNV